MEEDFQEMEEVVITGYQVLNKKKSTSAISSMKMDDHHDSKRLFH